MVTFSDKLSDSEVAQLPSYQKNLGEAFYKKCFYDSHHIAVNSFVKVLQPTSADSLEDLRYAQVLLLFKNSKLSHSNRAIVQWYTRPKEIADTGDLIIEDCELILDSEDCVDIPIEQVVGKFEMLFCRESQQPSKELKEMSSRHDMYVCRYKIVFSNGKYGLVPRATQNRPVDINQTPEKEQLYDKENNPSITSFQTTFESMVPLYRLSPSKRKCTVTPIKIVNKSVQKVSRTSLLEEKDDSDTELSAHKRTRRNRKNVNANVCRNLNVSLNDANYIVEQKDDLKIKLTNNQQKHKSEKNEETSSEEELFQNTPVTRTRSKPLNEDSTPIKFMQEKLNQLVLQETTPRASKTQRKSILKTPSSRTAGTPKRNVIMTGIVEEHHIESKRRTTRRSLANPSMTEPVTPKRALSATPSTPKSTKTSIRKAQRIHISNLTPEIKMRDDKPNMRRSTAQLLKESLHVSAVPKSLPCREQEFNNIKSFIESKILDECGGCMYVSGVPGTGKTATVSEVIRSLQTKAKAGELPNFDYVEINGMKMTEPRQTYVHMYRQLTGKTVAWEQAHSLLEHRFSTFSAHRKTTVLLVDELDILCTRRQDVVYNILDWPTKKAARLVVVTIANTMDLPERLLMGKITSRLGLTRTSFQPYSYKQLQEVVMARLADTNMFKSGAVQLVARKVASVSGDCRRALDICRRAVEIAEAENPNNVQVSMGHVQQTFAEMISSSKVQAIKGCSKIEQVFLRAVEAEVTRTGVEETTFLGVYNQFESILILMGKKVPPPGRAMLVSVRLGASKLILAESSRKDLYQKILLNVSPDDIHYALHAKV